MAEFKTFEYPLLIVEKHLDTLGHVNNAVYLEIFEEARWDLVSKNGYGLNKVKETGLGPAILEVQIRFQRELKLRTQVTVKTKMVSYTGKISALKQWIEDGQGGVYAQADFKLALFDLETRKIVRPSPEWLAALGMD